MPSPEQQQQQQQQQHTPHPSQPLPPGAQPEQQQQPMCHQQLQPGVQAQQQEEQEQLLREQQPAVASVCNGQPQLPAHLAARRAAVQAAVAGRFYLPADEVQALHRAAGVPLDTLLLWMLPAASHPSRPLISRYRVGAVGLGGSGAVYVGANMEFPRSNLSQSIHGEQFLLANLLLHHERRLHTLAVSAAPCGHCRQVFSELACADDVRFVFGHHGHDQPEVYSLEQILPAKFGPLDLLEDESAPLLLQEQRHELAWAPTAAQALQARAGDAAFAAAAEAALAAAKASYSPYTHCPSGVAILTAGGSLAGAGGYMESAAHNPGLSPFQAAVIGSVIAGRLEEYAQMREVVLVEVDAAPVSHEGIVRSLVAACGGAGASVSVLHVLRGPG